MQAFRHWPLYFAGRILPAAIGFAAIAIYTRLLDPASFGTYALLLSTSFGVGLIGLSWVRVASLRFAATVAAEDRPNLVATIAFAFLAMCLLSSVAIVVVVRIFQPEVGWGLALLTAGCAVASGWFELNITLFQARLQVVRLGLMQMARASLCLCVSVALIFAGLHSAALLAGFIAGNLVGFSGIGYWKAAFRGRLDRRQLRQLFTFGWPSSASSISYLSMTFQRYLLDAIGGSASVGIYAAASDFSQQTVGQLMGTATLAGQPLAFRARDNGDGAQLSEQMRNNARLIFAVGVPAVAGLIALSGPISQVYLGARFHVNAGTLMAFAAATTFLAALRSGYFEQAFEITFRTTAVAINSAARVALTVAFSFWLVPLQGAIGAAIAMLCAEALGFLASIVWARRLMHVPIPVRNWLKIAAAAIVMVGVLALMPRHSGVLGLSLAIVAGALVYAAAIAIFHVRGLRTLAASLRHAPQQSMP